MSGCRRSRRACAILLVLTTVTVPAVACTPAPYEGIPETVPGPATTTSTTSAATTTVASSTTPSTTVAPTPSTTPWAPTTAAPARPGLGHVLGATGVRMTLADPWQVVSTVDPRSLLPVLAEPLALAGLFAHPVLVATRPDATGALTPSVMAFELPLGAAPGAASTLAGLRAAVGRDVAASEPRPEPSRVGEGAYLTYQYTARMNGTAVEVVSEHYAFVRPGSVLVVTMTTTVDRANVDGRAFGAMLASLSPTG